MPRGGGRQERTENGLGDSPGRRCRAGSFCLSADGGPDNPVGPGTRRIVSLRGPAIPSTTGTPRHLTYEWRRKGPVAVMPPIHDDLAVRRASGGMA